MAEELSRGHGGDGCKAVGACNAEGVQFHHEEQHVDSCPAPKGRESRQISLGSPYEGQRPSQSTILRQRLHPTMGGDYDETFTPVAKYASIRTLFALLAGRKK